MNKKDKRIAGGVAGGTPSDFEEAKDIYGAYLAMLNRLPSGDAEALRTRDALEALFEQLISGLIHLAAEEGERRVKDFAGVMVARIAGCIGKYDEKLKKNAAYLEEKAKWGKRRSDVLVAPKQIMATTKDELSKALAYRRTLCALKRVLKSNWKEVARLVGIPEEYFPTVFLPDPSAVSVPHWWKFMWGDGKSCIGPLKKNNPILFARLREGQFPMRGKRREGRPSRFSTEFRRALLTLLKTGAAL